MDRILVGTDGSEPATAALTWAAGLAQAVGAQLVVASVLAPGLAGTDAGVSGAGRCRVTELLESQWCAPARALGQDVHALVLDGDPRTALLEAAIRERAGLLVVGSSGSGWFPALHLGHVAHAIAHHATVPVAVVRPGGQASLSGPLLVGVDGSSGSAAAIAVAGDLARSLDREVVAVHGDLGGGFPERRAELERECAEWTAPLRDLGVRTRVLVAQGWPAKAITEAEAAEHPALVVIGSRGAGGFHDLHLGSVALQLLHRATVPVVVVPSPA